MSSSASIIGSYQSALFSENSLILVKSVQDLLDIKYLCVLNKEHKNMYLSR